MRDLKNLAIMVLALALVSCATVQSRRMNAPPGKSSKSAGIAYFLPRQLAKITAKLSVTAVADAISGLGKAELAVSAADARVTAIKAAIADTENAIIANSEAGPARDLLVARLAEQKAALVKAQADIVEKKQARADAKRVLETAQTTPDGSGKYTVSLNIEVLPPTPDPAYGYRLSPVHNTLRDDKHKIAVSPAGLLTSTNVVAVDRTADIVTEIATFAGAITTGTPGRSASEDDPNRKKCPDTKELVLLVDFSNQHSVETLNVDLQCMGVRLLVSNPSDYYAFSSPPDAGALDGIAYRTPLDVVVRVERCVIAGGKCSTDTGWFPTEMLSFSLPQAGTISYLKQNAGFMTRTHYETVFKDGMLVNYDAERPSEMLEVARTPMRVVQGLFDGASKIISLRTGRNNSRATYTQSELSLLEAQYNLKAGTLTGDKKLTDAEIDLLKSQIALKAESLNGQSGLSAAELALLKAQAATVTGRNSASAEISASELTLMLALLRDQAKRDAVNKCITEKVASGEAIDSCLAQ